MKENVNRPLISIIIPTFNRAHLIMETLDSVLAQTYIDWECIVIDDGSIDETKEVLQKIISSDSRFSYYQRPSQLKKGPSSCRNYGLSISKGEFIQWLDSDDLLEKNKISTDLEYINKATYDFTISQSTFFDDKTKQIKRVWNPNLYSINPLNDFIIKKIGWGINSPLWRKSVLLDKHLMFNEDLQNRNDYFYHVEALIKGFKPIVIDEVLVSQREHNDTIQNKADKSDAKTIVNIYLLKNTKKIHLTEEVIKSLKKQSILILIRFYKRKKLVAAINFSLKLFTLEFGKRHTFKIIKLFVIGTFFRMTSLGYKYLRY